MSETDHVPRENSSRAGRRFDVIHDIVGESGFWRSLRALERQRANRTGPHTGFVGNAPPGVRQMVNGKLLERGLFTICH